MIQILDPMTEPPTMADLRANQMFSEHPAGNIRTLWVAKEAGAVYTERTGIRDAAPTAEDFAEANRRIPQDWP